MTAYAAGCADRRTWLRRVPAFVSDPVQLHLTLLQRLEPSVFVQGNHDRLNPAYPEDHLMVGDLRLMTVTCFSEFGCCQIRALGPRSSRP